MSSFQKHTYYNTYYYSNIVKNILSRDIELIGFISNFFSHESAIFSLIKPFEKESSFHRFIQYMIFEFFDYDMNENDKRVFDYWRINKHLDTLYADAAFENYDIDSSFEEFMDGRELKDYSDIEKYHEELRLCGTLELLCEKIANEVFYIMFNDREALLSFNSIVSEYVNDVIITEIGEENTEIKSFFSKDGVLKRRRVPEWGKTAVFHRDRGRCCSCGCDLTAMFNIESKRHFDHIIPLADGGINDVSNIQLLCSACNTKKSHREIFTSDHYQFWY